MSLFSKQRSRYTIPGILLVLELLGLFSALLGDGPYDWLAWITLLAPVLAILFYLITSGRQDRLESGTANSDQGSRNIFTS